MGRHEDVLGYRGGAAGGGARGDVPVVDDLELVHGDERHDLALGAVRVAHHRGGEVPVGALAAGVELPGAVEEVAAVGGNRDAGRRERAGDLHGAGREDLFLGAVGVERRRPGARDPHHGHPGGGRAAAADLGDDLRLVGERQVESAEAARHGHAEHAGLLQEFDALVQQPAAVLGGTAVLAQRGDDTVHGLQYGCQVVVRSHFRLLDSDAYCRSGGARTQRSPGSSKP